MADAPGVQVVGLGSAHGADRLGWLAIEALRRHGFPARFPPGRLALDTCPSPAQLPGLIRPGAGLLLIDALEGRPLGELLRISWADLQQAAPLSGSHGLGLREMLPLIETLYGPPGPLPLLGIGMGARATEPLDGLPVGLLPQLEEELLDILAGWREA